METVHVRLLNARLNALEKSSFRAKFHLGSKELVTIKDKGYETIHEHAADLIAKRLAPANLLNDGKQTPYRGHPVFPAQHATATCCRGCLLKWHGIPKDVALNESQQTYVVEIIMAWIRRDVGRA